MSTYWRLIVWKVPEVHQELMDKLHLKRQKKSQHFYINFRHRDNPWLQPLIDELKEVKLRFRLTELEQRKRK